MEIGKAVSMSSIPTKKQIPEALERIIKELEENKSLIYGIQENIRKLGVNHSEERNSEKEATKAYVEDTYTVSEVLERAYRTLQSNNALLRDSADHFQQYL